MPAGAEGDQPVGERAGFQSNDLFLVGDGEFGASIDALASRGAVPPRRVWVGPAEDPNAVGEQDVIHITDFDKLTKAIGAGGQTRVFFAASWPRAKDHVRASLNAAAAMLERGDFSRAGQVRSLAEHLMQSGYVPTRLAEAFPELVLRANECMGPPRTFHEHAGAIALAREALAKSEACFVFVGPNGAIGDSFRTLTADDYLNTEELEKPKDADFAFITHRRPECPIDHQAITPGLISKMAGFVKLVIATPGMLVSNREAVSAACADHGLTLCTTQEL